MFALNQPLQEPQPLDALTIDALAAEYCQCLMTLEALDLALRGGYAPTDAAYAQAHLIEHKQALGNEMRRRVGLVKSEPPASVPWG